jgi:small-conductance mechanosensitive channel
MSQVLGLDLTRWLELALAIAGTVLAGYVVSWITVKILEKTSSHVETSRKSSKIVKYVIFIMGAVLTIFYFVFDIVGALVGIGVLGIAIGIGLGTVLGNLVTGIVVLVGRTFSVGDEIKVAFFEGKVVKIGVQRVVLETKDGEIIFVPTAFFLSNPVSRKSRDGEQGKYGNGE